MSAKEKTIAGLLFGVQFVGAIVFCSYQTLKALDTVQGASISLYVAFQIYALVSMGLAIEAHRKGPDLNTALTIWIFPAWFLGMVAVITATLYRGYRWSSGDTTTVVITVAVAVLAFALARAKRLPYGDPIVKATIGIGFKAAPQALLAVKVFIQGGGGISPVSLVTGHLTIALRLIQIALSVRSGATERNRIWLGISEMANGLSWTAVAVAWAWWLLKF